MRDIIGSCSNLLMAIIGVILFQSCDVFASLSVSCGDNKDGKICYTTDTIEVWANLTNFSMLTVGISNIPDSALFYRKEFLMLDSMGNVLPFTVFQHGSRSKGSGEIKKDTSVIGHGVLHFQLGLEVSKRILEKTEYLVVIPPNKALCYRGQNIFNDTIWIRPMPSSKKKEKQ